ncbi:hypothetical protein [Haloarcula laminariae]|nr:MULTISPECIES: hypothetical protein [Halomicroarcula]
MLLFFRFAAPVSFLAPAAVLFVFSATGIATTSEASRSDSYTGTEQEATS